MHHRRFLLAASSFLTGALIATSCSSDTADTASASTPVLATVVTDSSTAPVTEVAEQPPCALPTTTTPVSAADLGNDRDWDITSFDGTVIRAHWFPLDTATANAAAPTLLMGPGWGGGGDTNENAPGLLSAISIKTLREHGYNVLTWDPRGWGESTGTVQIDSVDFEARDVQQLLDWVATRPEAALDSDGDPRSGMVGASYGGGIQIVTAAIDCRVDAIVPIIAWNSLRTSLFKAQTPKSGWGNLLILGASAARLDPTIRRVSESGLKTGVADPADVEWMAARGPSDLVSDIAIPTLVIQGTVDTLFSLDEGVANYALLQSSGAPVAMLWFCGGHGVCLTDAGDSGRISAAAIGWLDRYVKGDESVKPLTGFEFVDQDGASYSAAGFPEADEAPLTAAGSGVLELVATGGAGPAVSDSGSTDLIDVVALSITPGRATNAVDVVISSNSKDPAIVVGAPQLSFTYSGTAGSGDRPMRVFAQLVDDKTGRVLGNQITPIQVILDGTTRTVDVALETVAYRFDPGTTVTLQIVAVTVAYVEPRLGGSIDFTDVAISMPVVTSAVSRS
jgi:ABC-2 type transport system ATP-binding protein